MQVSLQGVSQARCKKMYNRFGVSLGVGQMCAGGQEGFDSCRGKIETNLTFPTFLPSLLFETVFVLFVLILLVR